MTEAISNSSGNVFADLGFDPSEAAILELRARLMADLRLYTETSGKSDDQLAETLCVSPPRVRALRRGDWEKFSLEMLVALEARAGRKVTIEVAA